MRELYDEVVDTDYGQFDLVWSPDGLGYDGEDDGFFHGQANGLVGAGVVGGVYLTLARRSGGSAVRIVRHDREPDLGEAWEDVVEVSTVVPGDAEPRWMTWAGEDGGPLAIPPGSYRVRVSAAGRDAGREGEFADGVVDSYLVELWADEPRPDQILRVGSNDARYWHDARGTRR